MEPEPEPEPWRPAGFWIRFLADIIDSLIVYFPAMVVFGALAPGPLAALLQTAGGVAVGAVYYTVLTGRTGQTWGKKALDLKVVMNDGSAPTPIDAFWRWCAYAPSYLTLCVGFMMAGWNPEKRALHDYLAGTRVIRKGAAGVGGSPWKVIGLAAGVAAVLAVAGALAAVSWFQRNGAKLRQQADAVEAEGKAFGAKTDQEGCVKEALGRLGGAGLFGEVRERIFLEACLASAAPAEKFCEEVPSDGAILATVAWRLAACERLGRAGDQACGRLLAEVQERCRPAQP